MLSTTDKKYLLKLFSVVRLLSDIYQIILYFYQSYIFGITFITMASEFFNSVPN
jgi:hypothetical protein